MALTLYLLLTDKRLYYALLELTAFVFILRSALVANRVGAGKWLKWLVPVSIGLGLEPLSRLLRLATEVVTSGLRLPRWEAWLELFCYWAGRIVLIYGAFLLYRFVRAEAGLKLPTQSSLGDETSWPPPIRPVE